MPTKDHLRADSTAARLRRMQHEALGWQRPSFPLVWDARSMPEIRAIPTVSSTQIIHALADLTAKANNQRTSSAGVPAIDVLHSYLDWTAEAERALRPLLRRPQVSNLLHTRRYWALRQMDGASSRLIELVHLELEDRADELSSVRAELQSDFQHWDRPTNLFVPDTNALYSASNSFETYDWPSALACSGDVHLVVPLVVVDEMDRHKRSQNKELRSRAADVISHLDRILPEEHLVAQLPGTIGQRLATHIELLGESLDHEGLPDPDSEIIDRAMLLRERAGRDVVLITFDRGMRLRAASAGVAVRRPQRPNT